MRLTTKVYLATALVATVGAGAIGTTSVLFTYQSEVSRVSKTLTSDRALIDATSIDALGDAITVGQSSASPISIAFLDSSNRLSQIHNDGLKIIRAPSASQLKQGAKSPVVEGDKLIASLKLSTGGYLLFEASIAQANRDLRANVARLLAIYLATLASMVVLVWLTLRRDLRSIRRINQAALAIANGDLETSIPDKRGNSEVEELARSLRKMVKKLTKSIEIERQSKAAIESFIGDASHELRTPLTVIRGYSELLPTANAAMRKSSSEKIIREVDKLTAMVNDLLLLARLGEVRTSEFRRVELDSLVHEAFADLQVLDPERPIDLKLAEVSIVTDPDLVTRFLANVTSNIHRYVPASANVKVTLSQQGQNVSLKIEDAGPGLPKQAYSEGIRSFKRFDASRSKSAGGTGLGMSIMVGIAENLGGSVKLNQSKLGGLCVLLSLSAK
ncbi:MAG: HAMP domain-containing sensor histidine kinase [Rhodoluna sp.]|nr:HAMP domain-containing sensor histidine kinase [Rhodoluna sp.]